ncbi:THO complex subunit 2-like isoform X2 [Cydia splendana]|uniref:THO complex subunit 2-like isoform X2 n=1 Tax=Cydia splendana TaxID=1100963 RepID=UPI0028F4C924
MYVIYLVCCVVMVYAEPAKDTQKEEYCTDPRTMKTHAAYTEWADAYSCTRHRCQPGGRNLAIYTVGCKRVEAPESAIECEEVVEDTNMQFPYCCTRLRCLVVVRGEVWTRVLGQPWETLPAAPWSHMYKMKKPPPVDSSFLPKGGPAAGPVYELSEDKSVDRRTNVNEKDCDKPVKRASPSPPGPDIVIALTTNNEKKPTEGEIQSKFLSLADDSDQPNEIEAEESHIVTEKVPEIISEERMFPPDKKTSRDRKAKFPDTDDEMNFKKLKESRPHKFPDTDDEMNYKGLKKEPRPQKFPDTDDEMNFKKLKESRPHKFPDTDDEMNYKKLKESRAHKFPDTDDEMNYKGLKKESRPHKTSLFGPSASSDEQYTNMNKRGKKQKVDAVSEERYFRNPEKKAARSWARIPREQWSASPTTRAQAQTDTLDYEKEHDNLVKAEQPSNGESEEKLEGKPASLQHLVNAIGTRMRDIENVVQQMSEKVQPPLESAERMRGDRAKKEAEPRAKQTNSDNYNRFLPKEGSSQYLHTAVDTTTEVPLFINDNLNGYFSDPSNNLLRRSMNNKGPKEPHETYMVPIDTDHGAHKKSPPDSSEPDLKHKKHGHKKRKSKHGRRKHRREEKKFNRMAEGNAVSLEDSDDFGKA